MEVIAAGDIVPGWRAGQIKVSSTTRSERTARWNRLLQIEHHLGDAARYLGAAALAATRHPTRGAGTISPLSPNEGVPHH